MSSNQDLENLILTKASPTPNPYPILNPNVITNIYAFCLGAGIAINDSIMLKPNPALAEKLTTYTLGYIGACLTAGALWYAGTTLYDKYNNQNNPQIKNIKEKGIQDITWLTTLGLGHLSVLYGLQSLNQ